MYTFLMFSNDYTILYNQLFIQYLINSQNRYYVALQHSLGEIPHCLPHTEISKHLLRATQDGIKLVSSIKVFNMLAHATLRQTSPAPDLDRLVSNFVRHASAAHLQETDRAGEVLCLLGVGHIAHLVGYCFEPGLVCFNQSNHFGEPGMVRFDTG